MRDLDLFGTFLEVYRTGSITAAAANLALSQPAVSERLARIEHRLGERLFERSRQGVTPTPAGDRLAARVSEPVDRLKAAWSTPEHDASGLVRIGGASDVVATKVIPALAPLTASGIDVEFTLGLADDLLGALQDARLDLVISAIRPQRSGIRSRGLVDEEFALIAAPSLARSISADLLRDDPSRALGHLPLVAYDRQLSIVRRYWRSQFGHRPSNPVAMIVPDLRGILAAVVAGVGISALPRYLADPAIASGSVELVHRPDLAPINTLFVAVPSAEPPSGATIAVIDRLVHQATVWDSL